MYFEPIDMVEVFQIKIQDFKSNFCIKKYYTYVKLWFLLKTYE